MLIERIENGWEITVPAKLNLFLEVVARRRDGYHELDTIMTAISLCDRLRFTKLNEHPRGEIEFRVSMVDASDGQTLDDDDQAWNVPTDRSNLVVRALEAVRTLRRIDSGIKVELFKGIPAQAGLGGGSADAAGAVVGGMLTWLGGFDSTIAGAIAANLGSDINFFLEGHAGGAADTSWLARCQGRGEIVEPIATSWRNHFVVLHPAKGCSTKRIFQGIVDELSNRSLIRDGAELTAAYAHQDLREVGDRLFNRLQATAANENEWIVKMLDELEAEPSVSGVAMTGSGSAVFGIVADASAASLVAERLRKVLKVRAYAVSSWHTPSIIDQLRLNGVE